MNKTVQEARRLGEDALDLLAHALGTTKNALLLSQEIILEPAWNNFLLLLERRNRGEPLQQILGYVDFFGCRIEITPDVLIPRQETELLAEFVVKNISPNKVLVDLCTGSGCLAIAIKKALPNLHVIGLDISKKALDIARKNADLNNVSVEFLEGDLLEPLQGRKFDYLVSNPPYVTEEEYLSLDPSVRLFEPRAALVGGLEFYKRIASHLPLSKLFLEIGCTQGEAVKAIFGGKGTILKDFAAHDRFFFLEIE